MQDKFINEVVELHQFFESWLSGGIAQTQPLFTKFKNALAEDFKMIEPSGKVLQKNELLEAFWHAHGAMPAPFSIKVKQAKARVLDKGLALVVYEEWQTGVDETARVSSALLRETDKGMQWLHVHETWLTKE